MLLTPHTVDQASESVIRPGLTVRMASLDLKARWLHFEQRRSDRVVASFAGHITPYLYQVPSGAASKAGARRAGRNIAHAPLAPPAVARSRLVTPATLDNGHSPDRYQFDCAVARSLSLSQQLPQPQSRARLSTAPAAARSRRPGQPDQQATAHRVP